MRIAKKRFLIWGIVALWLAAGAGTWWLLPDSCRHRKTPQSSESAPLASAKGWKISRSRAGRKVYEASVDRFSVERAKVGPFAIGPLRVARFQNVAINFFAEGLFEEADAPRSSARPEPFGIRALEGPLADMRKELLFRGRKIGILDIMGISLNLWEKGKRTFRISSDRATMDRKTGDLIFTGHASLDAAENGSLIAHRIRWDKKTSLFRVRDPYILTIGNKKKEGRELETDYLLKKVTARVAK